MILTLSKWVICMDNIVIWVIYIWIINVENAKSKDVCINIWASNNARNLQFWQKIRKIFQKQDNAVVMQIMVVMQTGFEPATSRSPVQHHHYYNTRNPPTPSKLSSISSWSWQAIMRSLSLPHTLFSTQVSKIALQTSKLISHCPLILSPFRAK